MCEEREKREERLICWCVRHSLSDILCVKSVFISMFVFLLGVVFFKVVGYVCLCVCGTAASLSWLVAIMQIGI